MSDGLIDPDAFLPGSKHLRPMAVRESAGHLRSLGTAVMARTTVVAAAWTGLGGCYQAPEREKVLSLMNPVATAGWDMATATGAAASALEAYAEELDPIRQDMKSLEGRAREFRDRVKNGVKTSVVGEVPGGGWGWVLSPGLKAAEAVTSDWVTVPWTQHGPSVTENNGLVDEYNTLLGRVEQAVNTCAAAVNQLAYTVLRAQSEAYGAFGALFSGSAEPPAWGYRREEDRNIIEQVYKGVWYDAVGGLASGGAALFGRDPVTGKWGSGGTAKQAWCGLGDLVGSLLVVTNPVAAPFASMGAVEDRTGWDLPGGPVTDWAGDRMKVVSDAGGSLIGYDPGVADAGGDGWHMYKDEPWRALSSSAVNVGTFFVPVAGGVGSGAKGASAAGKVAGGARAAAELVAPGASWVVRGTELLTHGGGALARTGSWSAAVEAVRAASGGGRAGLGGVTNGVAQALADLDKVPAPVHPRPEGMPSVSESVRPGDVPGARVPEGGGLSAADRAVLDNPVARESWLYQDAPAELSAAARADGAQVGGPAREPALVTAGGERAGRDGSSAAGAGGSAGQAPRALTGESSPGAPGHVPTGPDVPAGGRGPGSSEVPSGTREGPGAGQTGSSHAARGSGLPETPDPERGTARTTHGDGLGGGEPSGRGRDQGSTGRDGTGPEPGAAGEGGRAHGAESGADGRVSAPDAGQPPLGSGGHVAASDPVDYPRPMVDDPALVHRVGSGEVAVNEVFAARTGLDANAVYHVEGRGEFYTDADGKVVYVKTTFADDPSLPNPDLMHPQPGTTYVVTPRIKDAVEGLNYDHVLVVSDDRLTVTWHADHIAPGDAVRNPAVQRAAGGEDPAYEGGHFGPKEDGGGFEFVNLSEQLWRSNRGAGELSFNNMNRFFLQMVDGNPTGVTDITITARYPEGATPTPTTYTPRGGQSYTGSINPRPDHYVIQWTERGIERRPLTIPNDGTGWLRATEEIKRMRGEQ